MKKSGGRLRDPIWQFWSVVVTAGAVLVSLYSSYDIYVRSRSMKQVTVVLAYTASIVSLNEPRSSNIQVLYNGELINCASVVGVRIENSGNVSILPNDFASPLKISLPSPARIIATKIDYTKPQSLQPNFTQHRPSEIMLDPLLMNPGDTIDVELTSLDDCGAESTSLTATGRIVGVTDISLSIGIQESGFLVGLKKAYDTEAMIVIPIGTVMVFLLLWFIAPIWDWIETVFGRRPSTFWGRISLNLAVATLMAILLEDVTEGVIEISKALFGG